MRRTPSASKLLLAETGAEQSLKPSGGSVFRKVMLGYESSGMIHNLDEGDPEIVYFKRLK